MVQVLAQYQPFDQRGYVVVLSLMSQYAQIALFDVNVPRSQIIQNDTKQGGITVNENCATVVPQTRYASAQQRRKECIGNACQGLTRCRKSINIKLKLKMVAVASVMPCTRLTHQLINADCEITYMSQSLFHLLFSTNIQMHNIATVACRHFARFYRLKCVWKTMAKWFTRQFDSFEL